MYDDIIAKYASIYNVPEVWIKAVITQESSYDPNAYRAEPSINDASYGLMQILYKTAQGLGYAGIPEGLYDPDTNIMLGTKLLSSLRLQWGDNVQAVYSAYNSGSGTKYLTSPTVADHVRLFMEKLQTIISDDPLVVSSGMIGGVLVLLLLWYWKKGKH
jgi:soluble lytic murein transglycosylase-like protein